MDLFASAVVDDKYDGWNRDIWLRTVIGLISVGAMLGMYVTFKFGGVDEEIDALKEQNKVLMAALQDVVVDPAELQNALAQFQEQIDLICDNKLDLERQVGALDRLEKDLKAEARNNTPDIGRFLREVQGIFAEFKLLQIQVQQANLLNLFYELEFRDDDEEGLNQVEYNELVSRLDAATAEKMKRFESIDINGDGTIDLGEFQHEIDRIFKKINTKKQNKLRSRQSVDRLRKNKSGAATEWKNWLK